MKKLIVVLLSALVAIPAFSQFGIKVGVSTTSITMDDAAQVTKPGGGTLFIDKVKGAKYGINGGLFYRLNISKLYIQPEVLFTSRSSEYTISKVGNATVDSLTQKQTFNNISIPVMIGLKFGPLRLNAGPAATMPIGAPKELINGGGLKSVYAKMSFGYQAGIGLDLLKKLTIDLRYEGSLTKYQNKIESTTGTTFNLDDRPNAFLLSVGILFGGKK